MRELSTDKSRMDGFDEKEFETWSSFSIYSVLIKWKSSCIERKKSKGTYEYYPETPISKKHKRIERRSVLEHYAYRRKIRLNQLCLQMVAKDLEIEATKQEIKLMSWI